MGLAYGGMVASYCLLVWALFSFFIIERIKNDWRAIEAPCNKKDNIHNDIDGFDDVV